MSDDDFSGSDEEGFPFLIHDAAAAGNVEALRELLDRRAAELAQRMDTGDEGEEDGTDAAAGMQHGLLSGEDDPYLQAKDPSECTPLHLAIIGGHPECVQLLLKAKASVSEDCDGCPCLHLAVCWGALHPTSVTQAVVQALLEAGSDPLQRDDCGRLALHWCAELDLKDAAEAVLAAASAAADALAARVAEAGGDGDIAPELPNLLEMQDNNGDNVLHVAARHDAAAVLELLTSPGQPSIADAGLVKNKRALTPLGVAAYHGAARSAALLLTAAPDAAQTTDRHGSTPLQLAQRRGHAAVAALLASSAGSAAADSKADAQRPRTLIVAPPECELHLTCPDQLPRGSMPPPENVERLRVLVTPGRGILRSTCFADSLGWELQVAPAPIGDVLRVHDWNYLRTLQTACIAIPDRPDAIAHLDPDTAISHGTMQAALRAAAAACVAVDRVVSGAAANAFCAIRPPGHHAGPRGVVTSRRDRTGSHGFCLLNNVAIAAAYAMNVHRHAGISRVAILDFDVHHGNGTRACVANTAPATLRVPFTTPLSEGVHLYHTYSPWLDADDDERIFFASVQGYGPKSAAAPDAYVYPGSGATVDTAQLRAAAEAAAAAAAADKQGDEHDEVDAKPANGNSGAAGMPANGGEGLVEEDPDHEFPPTNQDEPPPLAGPRIIEVGIPGPGFHTLLWRRAWRDKVLPALVNFNPDLILVSAGFDAHRKDEINFRYIGVTEADYEWLTDQIVQVANKCCKGRIVSVLEGGYNINGGVVSAFARSVAAHVRALAEPNAQSWTATEAAEERATERRRREERAAKLEAKRAALQAKAAARAAEESGAAENGGGEGAGAGATAAVASPPEDGGRAKRRRTAPVDYAALNAKMEAEAAAAGSGEAAQ